MSRVASVLLLVVCLLVSSALQTVARADGLVQRLPEDGAFVQYDLDINLGSPGNQRNLKGEMRLSSVGTEVVLDDKCRWIEMKITLKIEGQEQLLYWKALIPEKELARGKSPGDKVVRCWVRLPGQNDAVSVPDLKLPEAGPLQMFLAGPPTNPQKLEKMEVTNTKLGKLECEGEVAEHEFDRDNRKVKAKFEHRFHEKALFGVVSSKMTFQNIRNGVEEEAGSVVMTLSDTGTSALTELPNNK